MSEKDQPSGWTCYLFGAKNQGITWQPNNENLPNWFWRTTQFLIFGNRWVKKDKE